jgi:hypothetical protein
MVFPIVGGDGKPTGYEIDNSIRLNDDDSHNISNNPGGGSGSDGSRTQFSISMWVKRSSLGLGDNSKQQFLTSAVATNNFYGTIKFGGNDAIAINLINSGSDQDEIHTDAVFRDVSAWYHLFFAFDKTQASLADGVKLYVNGVLQTFGTTTYTQNQGYHFFRPGKSHYIGNYNGQEGYFDGYMAEVHFVDGQVKAHTDFGETNDNGVWIPKDYTGSHGTYGFYLEFKQTGTSENSSGIGADTSGNDEHFAVANLAAIDVTTDTPTNNFCTLNSIAPDTTGSQNHNFFEGNTLVRSSSASWFNAFGTIGIPTSGKWYYEYKTTGSGSIDQNIGFVKGNFHRGSDGGIDQVDCYSLYAASNGNGYLYTDSASSVNKGSGYHWTHDDIMMVAIDTSSRKIWYGKNGTFLGSGDPASGSNEAQTVSAEDLAYGLLPAFSGYHTQSYHYVNFGNPSFSISSGNADANGYGNFEYAPPSGYYSLCTKNLAEFG